MQLLKPLVESAAWIVLPLDTSSLPADAYDQVQTAVVQQVCVCNVIM